MELMTQLEYNMAIRSLQLGWLLRDHTKADRIPYLLLYIKTILSHQKEDWFNIELTKKTYGEIIRACEIFDSVSILKYYPPTKHEEKQVKDLFTSIKKYVHTNH